MEVEGRTRPGWFMGKTGTYRNIFDKRRTQILFSKLRNSLRYDFYVF